MSDYHKGMKLTLRKSRDNLNATEAARGGAKGSWTNYQEHGYSSEERQKGCPAFNLQPSTFNLQPSTCNQWNKPGHFRATFQSGAGDANTGSTRPNYSPTVPQSHGWIIYWAGGNRPNHVYSPLQSLNCLLEYTG